MTTFTSEFIAKSVYSAAMAEMDKAISREKDLCPAMYADIRANLSAESVEKLSESPEFSIYEEEDNPYGLIRLILATHGGARTGWAVTDQLDVKQSVLDLKQGQGESLLTYKNRFIKWRGPLTCTPSWNYP